MSRTDTNKLIKDLCEMIEQDNSQPTHVTLVAGGQLITGRMISESEFFALSDNIALQEHFNNEIAGERKKNLDSIESGDPLGFPDELKEYFLYLADAAYILGSKSFGGLSIQVRVSDISAFTYCGLKV